MSVEQVPALVAAGEVDVASPAMLPIHRHRYRLGSITSSRDALNVIDSLIQDGTSSGVGYSALDANRDGDVSARDALYVINRIEVNQAIAQIVNDDSDDRESIVDQLLLDDNIGKLF